MSAPERNAIDVIRDLCVRFAARDALADRVPTSDGSIVFRAITFAELWRRAVALSSAWAHRGLVAPGDHVVICAEGSIEWMVSDVACLHRGAVVVPLSGNMPADDLRYIVNETAPVLIVCSPATEPLMRRIAADATQLRGFMIIDGGESDANASGAGAPSWRIGELEATACAAAPAVARKPRDVITVVYTSGGTGRPKGVPSTDAYWRVGLTLPNDGTVAASTVSYLPMSHALGRGGIVYGALALGGCAYFVPAQDLPLLLRAIQTVRPTFLTLIPAVSNFLHQQYRAIVAARLPPNADAATVAACESAVLGELRKTMLGDRLQNIRTGSAPTSPEVRRFLSNFGVVLDLYAASELGIVTINDELLPDIEYRLEDVPELGYTRADKPYPRGELLIRSWRAISGYFKRPDATSRFAHGDGFVRTGDIFEERGPRKLTWIDRKNTVLKLAQGEFVALNRLEHLFASTCARIKQIYIHGSSERDHLVAVVVPHESDRAVVMTPAFKQALRAEIEQAARAAELPGHEVPRDFIVEPEPFTVENQLLTDAGKLRRPMLKAKYEATLEALYRGIAERRSEPAELPRDATSVRDRVLGAAAMVLGLPRSEVAPERSFSALGGDSLAAVSVATRLEAQLGRAPSVASILDRQVTLDELARRLERELRDDGGDTRFSAIHRDGQREVRADELRLERFLGAELAASRAAAAGEPRTILVTGANGFLGRFIVTALLERMAAREGRVIALVRARDDEAARARFVAGFAPSGAEAVAQLEALARERLVVRAGDLTQPRLGLDATEYDALADGVDAIVHNGALVNHALTYRQLYEPNVLGTVEVLRLALRSRLKHVTFVSSIAVTAGARAGRVGEHEDAAALWPARPTAAWDAIVAAGYATSKWAGEILVRQLAERTGAGVAIARCGSLLPHTRLRRQLNDADTNMRLIASIAATGLAPPSFFAPGFTGARGLEGVPVDVAGAVVAALALEARAGAHRFHVSRRAVPGALGLDDIVAILERAGRVRARAASYAEWFEGFRAALGALSKEAQRHSALPLLSRWARPIAYALELDTTRFGAALAGVTGSAELAPLGEADVLAWLADLDQTLG